MEDVVERLTRVETKVEEHGKKLDAQVEKNDALTRLIVLFENQEKRQEERDRKQQEQLDTFAETMINVNENLKGLNKGLETLDNRVGKLENTESERRIDIPSLLTKIVVGVFLGIPTIITAWLLIQFKLK